MIRLADVYGVEDNGGEIQFLYDLLAERKVAESISHKRHPTFAEHREFVQSRPYLAWYVIQEDDRNIRRCIGSCYITKHREVGIWLMPAAKGKGAGKEAMRQLLAKHPGRVFTNTSIHNPAAFIFYMRCGFRHCANMLECDNVPSGGDHPGPHGVDPSAGEGPAAPGGYPRFGVDPTGG